jgi:hypothetical protein
MFLVQERYFGEEVADPKHVPKAVLRSVSYYVW